MLQLQKAVCVQEPEAAALSTLQERKGLLQMKVRWRLSVLEQVAMAN